MPLTVYGIILKKFLGPKVIVDGPGMVMITIRNFRLCLYEPNATIRAQNLLVSNGFLIEATFYRLTFQIRVYAYAKPFYIFI